MYPYLNVDKIRELNGICPGAGRAKLGDLALNFDSFLRYLESRVDADAIPYATPVNAVAATKTTALGVADTELVYTAKVKGANGNNVTVTYVAPDAESAELGIVVDGTNIVVNLATDALKAVTTKASDISAAIGVHTVAKELVSVVNKAANDGSGVVTAMDKITLAGGVNGTEGTKGQKAIDEDYIYFCAADNTINDANWKRAAITLATY